MINFITHPEVTGKTVFLRADINVPFEHETVMDFNRIDCIKRTIDFLIDSDCKIVLASHFGRPKGVVNSRYSFKWMTEVLEARFGIKVHFSPDCIGEQRNNIIAKAEPGEIILLENLRFHPEEEKNDAQFAKKLSLGTDIYVNDAFACCHREHASIAAITKFLPSFGGLLIQQELNNINSVIGHLSTISTAIIGGAKVSSKFDILKNLSNKVTNLVIGGAMANTFLAATGLDVGDSLYEPNLLGPVKHFLTSAKCNIILPSDVVCATDDRGIFVDPQRCDVSAVSGDDVILDLGKNTSQDIEKILRKTHLLLWNGPLGMVEDPRFAAATYKVAEFIGNLTESGDLKSVAGGGDIISALNKCNMAHKFTYVSTAGGAFLEYIGGHKLPGLEALRK